MTVEQAIRERLAGYAAVGALVGTRVYQLKLPQSPTLPAVRVQFISVLDFYHLRGGDLVEKSRVQVDTYAAEGSGTDPYAAVTAVAEAVHAALNGAVFDSGDSPMTLKITGIFRVTRMPIYEAAELREVRMLQDYLVWSRRVAA